VRKRAKAKAKGNAREGGVKEIWPGEAKREPSLALRMTKRAQREESCEAKRDAALGLGITIKRRSGK